MTPAEFAADLKRTRDTLQDASGTAVTGYRAPSFSIDKRTPWAHEVLADAGYRYSSSVAPVKHDHYGWPEAPRFAFKPVPGSALVELPVTTAIFAGRTLAAGGGGFFRLLPYRFSSWAIRQVNAEQKPATFYFHPWEIDPDQPRVENASLRSKVRHYARLDAMADKLRHVITDFEWDRVDRVVEAHNGAGRESIAA
jgi:polysaccharide deacetylase family protein (PEP-CTERM system associated)